MTVAEGGPISTEDVIYRDSIPSPGGWEVPEGLRPGWAWAPPTHGMRPVVERMPWWVRLWSHIPLVDRFAEQWMWFHGGYLVLPPDHPFLREYGPEAYEAVSGISKQEYERQLLEVARDVLLREFRYGPASIESVELDGEGLDTRIVVLFRLADRPSRVFGYDVKVWPSPHPDDYGGTPEWGDMIPIFLSDAIADPDRPAGEPDDQGITWLQKGATDLGPP